MDPRYEAYCLADPLFYDSPTSPAGRGPDFEIARRPLPEGWKSAEQEDWLLCAYEQAELPPQGWKVHASACLDNAEEILAAVWDHCVPRRIPFKFVRGERLLLLRNAKYADRGSSGKLATIYPADEAQLARVLDELGKVLDGRPGPYILSDLRCGAGPLHVRYGGFAGRYRVRDDGELEAVIEDGEGRLVADSRGPVFALPPWVTLPGCLEPIWRRGTGRQWRRCHTGSSAHSTSRTPVVSTRAWRATAGSGSSSRRRAPTPASPPTAPTPWPGCGGSGRSWSTSPGSTWCPRYATTSPWESIASSCRSSSRARRSPRSSSSAIR